MAPRSECQHEPSAGISSALASISSEPDPPSRRHSPVASDRNLRADLRISPHSDISLSSLSSPSLSHYFLPISLLARRPSVRPSVLFPISSATSFSGQSLSSFLPRRLSSLFLLPLSLSSCSLAVLGVVIGILCIESIVLAVFFLMSDFATIDALVTSKPFGSSI
ncbi:hypothetical protein TIFTF001_003059 [Ficus carica]|uniref:Uncharacterized protein n=1 Tax=Ficus carica TaxID=3494 RepID=A0AA87ZBD3_FICCA|nr:hypothetical protein TIFTF001_003059 [Ficus carica]